METKFRGEAIEKLKSNPNVLKCTAKLVIYTYEFKKMALEKHAQGISSRDIWRNAGFDLSIWKKTYFKDTIKDWKRIAKRSGFEGLSKLQGRGAAGRPKTRELSDGDKIKHLELEIKYLKAENDFLAKLRAKRAESNSGRIRNSRLLGN